MAALGVDGFPADVLHQIVHALLIGRPLEELGQARAHAGGDHRGDGDALRPAGDLRAIDADVDLSFPSFADERDVPSDRFQLAVDRRDAHSEQGRRFGAGQIASGE